MALQVKLGSIILLLTIHSLLVLCLPNDYNRNKKDLDDTTGGFFVVSTVEEIKISTPVVYTVAVTTTSTPVLFTVAGTTTSNPDSDDTTGGLFENFDRVRRSTFETARIIYIAVGVTFSVIVIIGITIGFVCFKRRRQQQRGFVCSGTVPAQQQQPQVICQQNPQQNLSEFPPPNSTQPAQEQQQLQHMSTLGNSQHSPQEQLYPPIQQLQPSGTLEFHNQQTTTGA